MKRLIIFLLLVSYFVSSSVFAGNKDFNFRRFTAADGLSSNTVRAILQDKRGYVWFGTDEGLNRYDGTGGKYLPIYYSDNPRSGMQLYFRFVRRRR